MRGCDITYIDKEIDYQFNPDYMKRFIVGSIVKEYPHFINIFIVKQSFALNFDNSRKIQNPPFNH